MPRNANVDDTNKIKRPNLFLNLHFERENGWMDFGVIKQNRDSVFSNICTAIVHY